jgi:hypothetical protein
MTGELPRRTPGASGYQRWVEGDLYRRVVFIPGPTKYSDPEDPAVQQHVLEVLNRPHIRAMKNHVNDDRSTDNPTE